MRESNGIDLAIFLCVIFLVVSALGTSGYRPGYLGLSQLLSHSNSPCTIGSKFSLNSSHHSLLLPFCYPSGNLSTAEVSCFHFHITPCVSKLQLLLSLCFQLLFISFTLAITQLWFWNTSLNLIKTIFDEYPLQTFLWLPWPHLTKIPLVSSSS